MPMNPSSTQPTFTKITAKSTRQDIAQALQECGVVAIVRLPNGEGLLQCAAAAGRGGCRALEVTLSVPDAAQHITDLSAALPDLLIGAGTITEAHQVHEVVDAGARYVISPLLKEDIIRAAHERGVPVIPGCQTPTEMFQAHQWGADFIKLFPAGHLPPSYIKNILAPLPELKIVPTGGIDADNAGAWIKAGAVAIGVGSALIDSKIVAAGDWQQIEERARTLVAAVARAR